MRPLVLFAPGAGAPSTHPWMTRWRDRLTALGRVETFDYPYMREGRKRPDPLPILVSAHRAALAEVWRGGEERIILIGKSMGGRIGCHVALEEHVNAVICLAYPLCGGGDPAKLRDGVLRRLETRVLFVQGTRDALCPVGLLERVRANMTVPSVLHLVEGGEHSLTVSKAQLRQAKETQDDVDLRILAAIAEFIGIEGA